MSTDPIRLVSDKLVLHEFVDTDETAAHSYTFDPLVTRFMDWGPNSMEDTHTFLREVLSRAKGDSTNELRSCCCPRISARGLLRRWRQPAARLVPDLGLRAGSFCPVRSCQDNLSRV